MWDDLLAQRPHSHNKMWQRPITVRHPTFFSLFLCCDRVKLKGRGVEGRGGGTMPVHPESLSRYVCSAFLPAVSHHRVWRLSEVCPPIQSYKVRNFLFFEVKSVRGLTRKCAPPSWLDTTTKKEEKKKTEKGETIKNNNNGIFKSRIERLVCDWIAKSTPPPHQIKNSSTRGKRIVRGGEADVYLTHLLLAMYSGLPTKRIKNTLPRGSRKQCCTKWRGEKMLSSFLFPVATPPRLPSAPTPDDETSWKSGYEKWEEKTCVLSLEK